MAVVALVCAKCGAPLPSVAVGSTFVTCEYCETTLHVEGAGVSVAKEAAGKSDGDRAVEQKRAFLEAFEEKMKGGTGAYDAFCAAAREHLGPVGQTDALARVTLALAYEFDAANKTNARKEATALSRIADAYIKACFEIARLGKGEMNLPFLTVNAEGPKHFLRMLTAADAARFASEMPREPAPTPRPPEPEEPPKKKGWWPFG